MNHNDPTGADIDDNGHLTSGGMWGNSRGFDSFGFNNRGSSSGWASWGGEDATGGGVGSNLEAMGRPIQLSPTPNQLKKLLNYYKNVALAMTHKPVRQLENDNFKMDVFIAVDPIGEDGMLYFHAEKGVNLKNGLDANDVNVEQTVTTDFLHPRDIDETHKAGVTFLDNENAKDNYPYYYSKSEQRSAVELGKSMGYDLYIKDRPSRPIGDAAHKDFGWMSQTTLFHGSGNERCSLGTVSWGFFWYGGVDGHITIMPSTLTNTPTYQYNLNYFRK